MTELISGISYRSFHVLARNYDVFFKTWKTSIIPPFLDPLFYLVGMGYGLGALIVRVQETPYIEFIAPALIASVMMTAPFFENAVGSYVRLYYQKTFDAMISTPVSIEDVATGEILYGAFKALIQGVSILIVIAAFGLIKSPLALLIPFLCVFAGFINGAIALSYMTYIPSISYVDYFFTVIMTPMFLFAGTFFPVSQLPVWAQKIAYMMPLYHIVNITRALCSGTNLNTIPGDLLWLLTCGLLFYMFSLYRMNKRMRK
ncbi:MAG: ABC transporter permease [candidate division Zixibacteria bacterium]|nr:ABC transporter permease [candidate division Zixibacteria bacterium]